MKTYCYYYNGHIIGVVLTSEEGYSFEILVSSHTLMMSIA